MGTACTKSGHFFFLFFNFWGFKKHFSKTFFENFFFFLSQNAPPSHQTTGKRPHRSRKPPNRLSKKKIGPAGPTTLPPTTRNTIFAPVLRATAPKLTANPWCWLGPRSFLSKTFAKKIVPFYMLHNTLFIAMVTPVLSTLYSKQKFLTRHAFGSFFYTAKMSCSGL